MIQEEEFFKKYNNIKYSDFQKTCLKWCALEAIYNDYLNFKEELEASAIFIFNTLMKSPGVHSVRYRIKDPEHLIEKIIRKKIANDKSDITLANYKEVVTDLIGLRALHLFKENWELVHEFINRKWSLKEKPTANIRKGDSEGLTSFFKQKNCEVNEHKYGYRSIHYIIETQPGKIKIFAEIQVRTIFEEAWAEIDHTIRYPYDQNNPIFSQFLLILNRLAGSADEMGSFIQYLKEHLTSKETEFAKQLEEKNSIISDLEEKISKINIPNAVLIRVKEDLEKLKRQSQPITLFENLNDLLKASAKYSMATANLGDVLRYTAGIRNAIDPILQAAKSNTTANPILQAAKSNTTTNPILQVAKSNTIINPFLQTANKDAVKQPLIPNNAKKKKTTETKPPVKKTTNRKAPKK